MWSMRKSGRKTCPTSTGTTKKRIAFARLKAVERASARRTAAGTGTEASRRSRLGLLRLDLAVPVRRLRDERFEQLPHRLGDVVHGVRERALVRLRRTGEPAHLADEL